MNVWRMAAMVWCGCLAQAAPAQEVELIDFSGRVPGPIIDLGVETTLVHAAAEDPMASSNDTLAHEFASFSTTWRKSPAAQVGVSIDVPTWMRLGVPPRLLAFRLFNLPRTSCAGTYRPRRDIHPSAEQRRAVLYPLVAQIACETGIASELLDALVVQESRYDPSARSRAGAVGLTQLMPGTASELGVDARNVVQNLRGGARYLRRQLDEFGRIDLALAAYNAGPNRVRSNMAVPAIRETQLYVGAILAALQVR